MIPFGSATNTRAGNGRLTVVRWRCRCAGKLGGAQEKLVAQRSAGEVQAARRRPLGTDRSRPPGVSALTV